MVQHCYVAECRGSSPRPAHDSLTAALTALSAPVVSRTDTRSIVPRTGLRLQSETRLHSRTATSSSLVQVVSRPAGQCRIQWRGGSALWTERELDRRKSALAIDRGRFYYEQKERNGVCDYCTNSGKHVICKIISVAVMPHMIPPTSQQTVNNANASAFLVLFFC